MGSEVPLTLIQPLSTVIQVFLNLTAKSDNSSLIMMFTFLTEDDKVNFYLMELKLGSQFGLIN